MGGFIIYQFCDTFLANWRPPVSPSSPLLLLRPPDRDSPAGVGLLLALLRTLLRVLLLPLPASPDVNGQRPLLPLHARVAVVDLQRREEDIQEHPY